MEKQELPSEQKNGETSEIEKPFWVDMKYLKSTDSGKGHVLDIPAILEDHRKMVSEEIHLELRTKLRTLSNSIDEVLSLL